jgi:hypothetical protein
LAVARHERGNKFARPTPTGNPATGATTPNCAGTSTTDTPADGHTTAAGDAAALSDCADPVGLEATGDTGTDRCAGHAADAPAEPGAANPATAGTNDATTPTAAANATRRTHPAQPATAQPATAEPVIADLPVPERHDRRSTYNKISIDGVPTKWTSSPAAPDW